MNIEETREKERVLTDAQSVLKSEFIGIDGIIDSIISNIRVWYLFPEMVSKPLVINLWGLTGCGKTSLVGRLCELLGINGKTVVYNLSKLDDDDSEKLEDTITESVSNRERNPVFVFDEFQFAATKSEDGKEKDSKSALKTIWELIDSGTFRAKLDKYLMSNFSTFSYLLSYLDKSGVTIENGKLKGMDKLLGQNAGTQHQDSNGDQTVFPSDTAILIDRYFNYEGKPDYPERKSWWCESVDEYVSNDSSVWYTAQTLSYLFDIHRKAVDDSADLEMYKKELARADMKSMMQTVYRYESKSKGGYVNDYSGALVFVIGNIDEAYTISYDLDPDMDADQFHKITSDMTMVDIKEALQDRFRNEQIARLGNIMLMYPSFSSGNFIDIIRLRLSQYRGKVLDNFGITVDFDDSIVDIIYKDGVFPTQGTRPVFSSVYEIVETKLPQIVLKAYEDGIGIKSARMSYSGNEVVAEVHGSDGAAAEYRFAQKLKIEDLRKNKMDERQAITAVHESMHFVMYAKLFGRMPDKLVSSCVSGSANGFMMPSRSDDDDFVSRSEYISLIQVDLAGYVAEKHVFGEEEFTSGAEEDLANATVHASEMARKYAMFEEVEPCTYTYLASHSETEGGMLVNDKVVNSAISLIVMKTVTECERKVEETLKDPDWRRMFAESARYLFENVSMPKEKMAELYEAVPEKKRKSCVRSGTFYRDRLEKFTDSCR